MKKSISVIAAASLLLSSCSVGAAAQKAKAFHDISGAEWYSSAVYSMYEKDIIPYSYNFLGDSAASRKDIVLYLYNLARALGYDISYDGSKVFTDVGISSPYYDCVNWASEKGIVSGYSDGSFAPDSPCSREQLCVMAMRFANAVGIRFKKVNEPEQFIDSLSVSGYARSYVVASRVGAVIGGDERGYFRPSEAVTLAQAATVTANIYSAAKNAPSESDEVADTSAGAYDPLYDTYKTEQELTYTPVAEAGEAIPLSYFDDVALIGDSVTMSLQYYCASSGALGNVKFICAGSLSPANALWNVSSASVHPVYQGVKRKVEESVALSGVKKVYIMLGINSLSMGLDKCVSDMQTLIANIKAASPDVEIVIQSVTPMTKTSPIRSNSLNNSIIDAYNARMLELCKANHWYYVNVAEVMKDAEGNLFDSYCSDPRAMGIHFNYTADSIWADYLKTHVPQSLR